MIRWSTPKIGIKSDLSNTPNAYGGGWGNTYVEIPKEYRRDFRPQWSAVGDYFGDKAASKEELRCAHGIAREDIGDRHTVSLVQEGAYKRHELQTLTLGIMLQAVHFVLVLSISL